MMQGYFCHDLKELAYEDGRARTPANNGMAGVRELELGNVGFKNSRTNSLVFQNIFVLEQNCESG
jgi:hypothetical protein